ncbi:hypothetical protein SDC9_152289 [bioreactor metagenome]|uniref:Uncharacterized protein n=1 Tax=bioreactor metagenome TaxID=1076179 RepID=A0A645EV08_9ZZZZ
MSGIVCTALNYIFPQLIADLVQFAVIQFLEVFRAVNIV